MPSVASVRSLRLTSLKALIVCNLISVRCDVDYVLKDQSPFPRQLGRVRIVTHSQSSHRLANHTPSPGTFNVEPMSRIIVIAHHTCIIPYLVSSL